MFHIKSYVYLRRIIPLMRLKTKFNASQIKQNKIHCLALSSIASNYFQFYQKQFHTENKLLNSKNGDETVTVNHFIQKWEQEFEKAGILEPQVSIWYIMLHLFGFKNISDLDKIKNCQLSLKQQSDLERFCQCRLANMPVQYIIGNWDFRDFTVKLKPPVFIPRPETEELIEIILSKFPDQPLKILELGCGSGVISLALLKELPRATCVALDQSRAACHLTLENAKNLNLQDRLTVINGKVTDNGIPCVQTSDRFDIIVSNPPYIPQRELRALQPEILLYEDLRALDGGIDGLSMIKVILQICPPFLAPEGKLFLEVHPQHFSMIEKFLLANKVGLRSVQSYVDVCNKDRFLELGLARESAENS